MYASNDYRQGDEAKFTGSYRGGASAMHISTITFDKSRTVYLVQGSVPFKNGGNTIRAIAIGVNVDIFK